MKGAPPPTLISTSRRGAPESVVDWSGTLTVSVEGEAVGLPETDSRSSADDVAEGVEPEHPASVIAIATAAVAGRSRRDRAAIVCMTPIMAWVPRPF
ncbi:hypothetical protein GCM10010988_27970 [Cnuibacter physcomitrellae]|nr:hypothetical protein GCM10010988_27970 [Cnuibacter physcomitrellae]